MFIDGLNVVCMFLHVVYSDLGTLNDLDFE